MDQNRKNLRIIVSFVALLFILLTGRLAYIQILGGSELAAATRTQSLIALEGSNTRGIIYDRNGEPLVAGEKHFVYIIKDDDFDSDTETLLKQLKAKRMLGDSTGYHVFESGHYDKETGKKLIEDSHAYILQASDRYGKEQLATHLIGYVNQKDASGAAGLELMYDEQLSGLNRHLYAVADVKGNILPGRGLIITSDDEKDSYVQEGIRTTVDKGLQQAVEEIIGENQKACAVVVLDTRTGGVAAMASTPDFDPDNISRYMKSDGNELINKTTQGEYAPGSVFKIIVAAAALEEGIEPEDKRLCNGQSSVGDLSIGCETGGASGHGEISFEEAFAKSCNSFFVEAGRQVGADRIIEMAESFGLGENVLDGFPQEKSGHLMDEGERWGDAIGNLSIGQGEILVTPLQVAAMTNIIANGGIDTGVHLLMGEESETRQVISPATAGSIGNMMELVTTEGTGKTLQLISEDGMAMAAVKTGTAEYGVKSIGGTHGWITGYTPCRDPEYTITVLVEGGVSGASAAGPIFERIVEYLKESGSYSMPAMV